MSTADGYDGLERFDNVDATRQEAMFFDFLDRIDAIPDVAERRERSFELLELRPGASVADVGCGIGTVARALVRRVAPGRAHGIDVSASMIDEARRRAAAAREPVLFHCAPAERLPLDDRSLDGYRAERLLQHLAQPSDALAEAYRVLKPGGRIVIVDQDWDLAILDAEDLHAARLVHRSFADSLVNPASGRRLRALLLDAGFAGVRAEAETVVSSNAAHYGFVVDIISKNARDRGVEPALVDAWEADQRRRIAGDRFLMVMTHMIASGTRP